VRWIRLLTLQGNYAQSQQTSVPADHCGLRVDQHIAEQHEHVLGVGAGADFGQHALPQQSTSDHSARIRSKRISVACSSYNTLSTCTVPGLQQVQLLSQQLLNLHDGSILLMCTHGRVDAVRHLHHQLQRIGQLQEQSTGHESVSSESLMHESVQYNGSSQTYIFKIRVVTVRVPQQLLQQQPISRYSLDGHD